jgi:hypothetical protein
MLFVFSDMARMLVIYFYGGFSQLRINVSDHRLSFPTSTLSENCEFQNYIIHVTACRTRVPASHCKLTKKSVYTNTDRDDYLVPSADGHTDKIHFILTCRLKERFLE